MTGETGKNAPEGPGWVLVIKAFDGRLNQVLRFVVVVLISLSTLLAFFGVVMRYGFGISYAIVEESCRYLIVYAVFLYFGQLIPRNAHLRMSILSDRLSPHRQRVMDILTYVVVATILAFLTQAAIQWEMGLYGMGILTMSGELRAYIPSAALPIGMGLGLLGSLFRIAYGVAGIPLEIIAGEE